MNKTAVCFRKRTWNLGSDRCGFKACIFHLLAIWPWANHLNLNISLSYVTKGNSTFQELLKELCLTYSRFSRSGAYKKEEEVLSCWKLTIVNEAFSIAKVQPAQPVRPSKDEAPSYSHCFSASLARFFFAILKLRISLSFRQQEAWGGPVGRTTVCRITKPGGIWGQDLGDLTLHFLLFCSQCIISFTMGKDLV